MTRYETLKNKPKRFKRVQRFGHGDLLWVTQLSAKLQTLVLSYTF